MSTIALTDDAVAAYHRDGFGHLDRLIDDDTVAALRAVYDRVIASDFGDHRQLGGVTRQLMMPSLADPAFDRNQAVAGAMRVARQLLDTDEVTRTFDMLIFKPPGHPHSTPWHQDASYVGMPHSPAGMTIPLDTIQFWVALDDADEENGCMHFLPGYHTRPMVEHRVASGDPTSDSRLLEVVDVEADLDLRTAVPVPLAAGGCTFHSFGTPHYTPPNRSADRPRRAYIFNLATRSRMQAMLDHRTS